MTPPPRDAIILDASISDLSAAIAAGRTSAAALVDAYVARIGDPDRRGPELHAIIELNPDARSIAEALDRERADRGVRGVRGIPIVLEDNIGTADRMETSAGSFALVGARPPSVTSLHVAAGPRASFTLPLGCAPALVLDAEALFAFTRTTVRVDGGGYAPAALDDAFRASSTNTRADATSSVARSAESRSRES